MTLQDESMTGELGRSVVWNRGALIFEAKLEWEVDERVRP